MIKMKLDEIRKLIGELDEEILRNLAKRKTLVKEIAVLKKSAGMPVIDEKREREILEKIRIKSEYIGIDEEFALRLFKIILENSRKEQGK